MPNKPRILAVDDNPTNLLLLEEILIDDYSVRYASNAREAFAEVERFQPWAILMDVMMPGMDGLDACGVLRHGYGMEDAVIILVSAKAMPSERTAGLNAGADAYITRPFDEVELLALLRKFRRRQSLAIQSR